MSIFDYIPHVFGRSLPAYLEHLLALFVSFNLRPLPKLPSVTPREPGINLFSIRPKGTGDGPAHLVAEACPTLLKTPSIKLVSRPARSVKLSRYLSGCPKIISNLNAKNYTTFSANLILSLFLSTAYFVSINLSCFALWLPCIS